MRGGGRQHVEESRSARLLAARQGPVSALRLHGQRLIRELARLITENRTTLVFSNTRSGAEAATFWLHQALPELAGQIECHHARSTATCAEVEDRNAANCAVVCSTSLELGIDIGSVDLVVMLSTPKGVSRALQRTGRAGHNIKAISRGLLMATNMNDLVECCATVLLARTRQLDPVRLPRAPSTSRATHRQHGLHSPWSRAEAGILPAAPIPIATSRKLNSMTCSITSPAAANPCGSNTRKCSAKST